MKNCFRLIIHLAPLLATGVLLTSCSTPSGEIHVDHPAVYTRERLVDSRLQDMQWLQQQLNQPVTSTFQGGRTQSEFSGFTAQLQAQFDPLGAASAGGAAQVLQSSQHVNQLQADVMATALGQKLQDLQHGKLDYNTVLGSNAMTAAATPTNFSFAPSNGAQSQPISFAGTNTLPGLPGAGNMVFPGNNIQLTPSEQFRDRLAYRDTVEAEMREKELDDTHDRAGMTLYSLKFDLSVLPGKNNSASGRADVTFEKGEQETNDASNAAARYRKWLFSLRRTFDEEVISIQRRYLQGYLTDEEKRRLTVYGWGFRERIEAARPTLQILQTNQTLTLPPTNKMLCFYTSYLQGHWDETSNNIADEIKDYDQLIASFNSSGSNDENVGPVLRSLSTVVARRFYEALQDDQHNPLVSFGRTRPAPNGPHDYRYMIPLDAIDNEGPARLSNLITNLDNEAKPFVYAAEPKESAQNLTDTSAKETVRNFSLALAAAIPQISTTASAYLDYIKRNQYLVETINRKPLLVAYARDATNFGWIIGPRFTIDKNLKLGYEQGTLQESVQATIVVPAWWSSVRLRSSSSWLAQDMSEAKSASNGTNLFEVRLRPNMDALTRAILERSGDLWLTQPQIHPRWDTVAAKSGYTLQAGKTAQLLIVGRNLWRNPLVFIGSQANSSYRVLPDMAGIVAQFDPVISVPTAGTQNEEIPTVDLRVVTSDGESVLKDAVTIIPEGSRPETTPVFVTMTNFFGVPGSPVSFAVDTSAAPASYARYDLALSQSGEKPQPVQQVPPATPKNGAVTFQMPGAGAPWTSPARARVDVWLKSSPDNEPKSVLRGGEQSFIVFTTAAQSQFLFGQSVVTVSTNSLDAALGVGLPTGLTDLSLFWDAWPNLQAALKSGAALQLTTTGATGQPVSVTLDPVIFDLNTGGFTFKTGTAKTIIGAFSLQNGGPAVSCTGKILVPATNPKWTIPISNPISFTRKD